MKTLSFDFHYQLLWIVIIINNINCGNENAKNQISSCAARGLIQDLCEQICNMQGNKTERKPSPKLHPAEDPGIHSRTTYA